MTKRRKKSMRLVSSEVNDDSIYSSSPPDMLSKRKRSKSFTYKSKSFSIPKSGKRKSRVENLDMGNIIQVRRREVNKRKRKSANYKTKSARERSMSPTRSSRNLEFIFINQTLYKSFEEYLKKQFCEEILYCFTDMYKFSTSPSIIYATEIGNKYLGLLPNSVPISSINYIEIELCCEQIRNGCVDAELFEGIESNQKNELLFHWNEFINHPTYKKALKISKSKKNVHQNNCITLKRVLNDPEEYNLFYNYLDVEQQNKTFLLELCRDVHHVKKLKNSPRRTKDIITKLENRYELHITTLPEDIQECFQKCFNEGTLDYISGDRYDNVFSILDDMMPSFAKKKKKSGFLKKVSSREQRINIDISLTELSDVPNNKLLQDMFRSYLESVFASENLDFYMAYYKFKKNFSKDLSSEMKVAARNIGRSFLGYDGHELVIGISDSEHKSLCNTLASENFSANVFDSIIVEQKRILRTMYLNFNGGKKNSTMLDISEISEYFVESKELELKSIFEDQFMWKTSLVDDYFIVVYRNFHTMLVCDISDSEYIYYINDGEHIIHDYLIDGKHLFVVYDDHVNLINLSTLQEEVEIETSYLFEPDPNGKPVIVVNPEYVGVVFNSFPDTKGYLWRRRDNNIAVDIEFNIRTKFGVITQGLTRFTSKNCILLGTHMKAQLWDFSKQELIYTFLPPGKMFSYQELIVHGNSIQLRTPDRIDIYTLKVGSEIRHTSCSLSGTYISSMYQHISDIMITGDVFGNLHLFDSNGDLIVNSGNKSGEQVNFGIVSSFPEKVNAISCSFDGKYIFSGYQNNLIKFWLYEPNSENRLLEMDSLNTEKPILHLSQSENMIIAVTKGNAFSIVRWNIPV
eukprot:TRINITY_DN9683_c0_g1_i1.p1 TRINITY_DN9683_c0_g1~~TRINITY_DN9683_c0_g1_i1.p1  ORF type:complete len:859 (-),score=146.52 TRINITY_DN9683_c0_g1_i1:119-2695(-)